MKRLLRSRKHHGVNQVLLTERLEEMSPVIQVQAGSDLDHQLKMLDISRTDLAVAQVLKPYVEKESTEIIDAFYKNLEHHPPLLEIINENSSIDRLKKTLKRHVVEMFAGEMNDAFIEKRKIIAHIHVKIGLTQKWYIASFQKLFDGLYNIIFRNLHHEEDRLLALKVVNKLLNLEQQVVLEAYDDEVTQMKESSLQSKLETVASLEETSVDLASLAQQTNASFEEMTAQLDVISNNSKTGTTLALEAKDAADEGRVRLEDMGNSVSNMEDSTSKVTEDRKSVV